MDRVILFHIGDEMDYNIEKEELLELLADAFEKGHEGGPELKDTVARDILNKFIESTQDEEEL